jgi:hypothetical protein
VIPPASESLGPDGVTLDTTFANMIQSGYFRLDQTLDSAAGFQLTFELQVLSESHGTADRAGFSVIVLDEASRGLELGFWTGEVWAQEAGFTHAEGASWTTTEWTRYDLVFSGASYALFADGDPLLAGALRDYSAFGLPYTIPNLIFFGDDTTSAKAQVTLRTVSLTAIPEPATGALVAGALVLLAMRPRTTRRA